MLDGMFSFVLLDTKDKSFIAARDAIGITPLYLGWGHDGKFISAFNPTFYIFTVHPI
jgi:asparagine synthetase B (glutamine-hydrolysing)